MFLFIDTSDPEQSALYLIGTNFATAHIWQSRFDQAERLHAMIGKFLKRHKTPLQKLKKIGVVVGPGPFSRVRTGVVTANTLGYALNVPIVGVKKLGKHLNFSSLAKQKGTKSVAVFYDRPPNITKPKAKTK